MTLEYVAVERNIYIHSVIQKFKNHYEPIRKIVGALMLLALLTLGSGGCEKDKRVPPSINLKSYVGYVSSDTAVYQNQALTVGVTAEKMEDDMLTYNVSYAYDGATSTTYQTFNLTGGEQQHYEKDVTFSSCNQSGTEKWIFTITDKDGNIAQKQITLAVQ